MRLGWIVLLVSCAQPPRSPVFHERIDVTRSPPETFFGIEGMTSLTESTYSTGAGTHSQLIISRGTQVACVTPFGQLVRDEHGLYDQTATLQLASREPVRFAVELHSQSNDLGSQTSCLGFELPARGKCRQVFDRQCSHELCTPNVTISPTCGSGTLKGHITQERGPVVSATVVSGPQYAFTDEHGAFAIEAGAGSHVVEIDGATLEPQRTTVTIGAQEDVDVAIDIRCQQVIDSSCCAF